MHKWRNLDIRCLGTETVSPIITQRIFYNYSYRVYIYMDEGQWWADVHTHGYITGEYGPFESPMSADMYVCNVNGFKGGARRKRAQVYTLDELRAELKSMKRHGGDMQADAIMNMHENDINYWVGFIAAVDKIELLIGR